MLTRIPSPVRLRPFPICHLHYTHLPDLVCPDERERALTSNLNAAQVEVTGTSWEEGDSVEAESRAVENATARALMAATMLWSLAAYSARPPAGLRTSCTLRAVRRRCVRRRRRCTLPLSRTSALRGQVLESEQHTHIASDSQQQKYRRRDLPHLRRPP